MKKEHNTNTIYALLDDESFIRWVLCPTPELDRYWYQKARTDTELAEHIDMLKEIIERLKVEEPQLSAQNRTMMWDRIQETIADTETSKPILGIKWFRMASAVAIVIIAIGLFFTFIKKNDDIDYASILQHDEDAMRSGNVSLVLSNDKVLEISKDSSVVAYDNKGRVNVNSEQVEADPLSKLNQLIVPYGKTTSVILSDGTKIWINSGSKLIYPSVFDKSKREIFVEGEIYLDVKRNEQVPFVIKTNRIEVNVFGTKLNISAYREDTEQSVVLVSGSVSVKGKEQTKPTMIVPSQMFTFDIVSQDINVKNVDVENYTSWVNGYLLLHSESLNDVILKIERHYNMKFSYDRESFKNIHVSGKLDMKERIDEVLDFINVIASTEYQIKGDNVQIRKTKNKNKM